VIHEYRLVAGEGCRDAHEVVGRDGVDVYLAPRLERSAARLSSSAAS
jgi:hypothetical protein